MIDWLQVLDRVPTIPDRAKRIAEAEQVLRAMRAHNAVGRGQTETLELAGSPLRLFADLSPNIVRYLKVLRRGARGRPRSSAPAQRARRDGGLKHLIDGWSVRHGPAPPFIGSRLTEPGASGYPGTGGRAS